MRIILALEWNYKQYKDNSPCLLIKGKIRDVDGARTLIDCRWNPQHFAIGINQHVRLVPNLIVTIGVVEQDNIGLYIIGFIFFPAEKTSTDHNDGELRGEEKIAKWWDNIHNNNRGIVIILSSTQYWTNEPKKKKCSHNNESSHTLFYSLAIIFSFLASSPSKPYREVVEERQCHHNQPHPTAADSHSTLIAARHSTSWSDSSRSDMTRGELEFWSYLKCTRVPTNFSTYDINELHES